MVKQRTLSPKSLFDEDSVLEAFAAHNIKPLAAKKLWRYLIQQPDRIGSYHDIPEFPKAAAKLLDEEFVLTTSKVVSRTDAKDGSTTKLLIELQDGQRIESVIMRYGEVELDSFPAEEAKRKRLKTKDGGSAISGEGDVIESLEFSSNKRATLCVSSQVGCAMGCTFCATGTMGLLSNLTAGEIVEQLYHANKVEKIRNIVFMGMGEPLDNYNAVLSSIKAMVDTARFGLSPSRISVSTVGVVPRIRSLMTDAPNVGLALSLHAPTQHLRQQIVPTSKAWHVDRILAACDAFIANQNKSAKSSNRRRHILVEYVLIADVNDSQSTAHELGQLLKDREVLLNIIPYNVTSVPHDYKTPDRETSRRFAETVRGYGVHTLLRQTMGADSASACGQLVIDNGGQKGAKKGAEADAASVLDLEDLMSNNGSTCASGKATPPPRTRAGRSTNRRDAARSTLVENSSDPTDVEPSQAWSGIRRNMHVDRLVPIVAAGLVAVVVGRIAVKAFRGT
ncbi:uncharacterized protein EV422DRAFT_536625 [Fimicolochytrium jonesii]|uniref:uncharacterized protein n=1 Tax=Fimicolochytrium jonesii TaxID=1396493 RepID=UPI0022FE0D50|nr:uncharacterized protein EV422DRAFT_536625 [Fimicolochytrium jonesii]KAI8818722.1 hypothetical protein EV422DRAFT_536625 [Fimicolochytrium jonesii]